MSEVTRLRPSVQSMLNVLCPLRIPSAGPLLSDDCVFFRMSSRYFICQILFQHDRHDITSVSDITSTCWTTMRKHSTWQVIKMLNPGESCIYDGWMYVYLIFLLFDRRSMHEIRLYQSKLLPTGEYFRVPLNVLEEEQKPMAMPRVMKKWNMYPSQSKGQESRNKITGFSHCFREVCTFDSLKALSILKYKLTISVCTSSMACYSCKKKFWWLY